jgi:hypothetical protein
MDMLALAALAELYRAPVSDRCLKRRTYVLQAHPHPWDLVWSLGVLAG